MQFDSGSGNEFLNWRLAMTKKIWWKSALMLVSAGTALSLGFGSGCLAAAMQRILVAVNFD